MHMCIYEVANEFKRKTRKRDGHAHSHTYTIQKTRAQGVATMTTKKRKELPYQKNIHSLNAATSFNLTQDWCHVLYSDRFLWQIYIINRTWVSQPPSENVEFFTTANEEWMKQKKNIEKKSAKFGTNIKNIVAKMISWNFLLFFRDVLRVIEQICWPKPNFLFHNY